MPRYYPVFLNVESRPCVIIGGGEVAERKIESLLECGAHVNVISPEVTPGIEKMAQLGTIHWEKREYQQGDLEGGFLAIDATDDNTVNRNVSREAEKSRVLLNVVDVTHLCTFIRLLHLQLPPQ